MKDPWKKKLRERRKGFGKDVKLRRIFRSLPKPVVAPDLVVEEDVADEPYSSLSIEVGSGGAVSVSKWGWES